MLNINCATGTIAPFVPSEEMPWNRERVQHLYRRMGFGASVSQLETGLAMSPSDLVDALIEEAVNLPLPDAPEWADWTINDYTDFITQREEQLVSWVTGWVRDMTVNGFREKLALFWHNHFVTRFEAYQCTTQLYHYHKLLQQHALGNFKTFVYEMGKNPAMLVFLNGVQNTRFDPNENYARELYELFTLGRDNGYTQDDIKQTARALTGWVGYFAPCGPIGFVREYFDDGVKTIFGQTGAWNYDDVHDILFDRRADEIATYICTRIYRHFVHPEVDPEIVAEMAATFKDNNFELIPVFRQLFKSEHFFDRYVIGTTVKSPVDYFISFIRDGGFEYNEEVIQAVTFFSYSLGQELFNPIDVAGWPGNRAWINSNTLTGRWQYLRFYIFFLYENFPALLANLAKTLSGNSIDPALVAQSIVDYFVPNGLNTPEAYDRATAVLKWEVPQNYYDQGLWNLEWDTVPVQVALLLDHIIRLPEFQLN